MFIENLFNYLTFYSNLFPILLFLLLLKKVKGNRILWIIFFYLLFDFLTNFLLAYLIPTGLHNKVYPVFTFVESLFFAGVFYYTTQKEETRKIIILSTIIFSAFALAYYYYTYFVLAKKPWLDSVPIGIETILMFIFTLLYFFEQTNSITDSFIYYKPCFWGVLGIFIYLSGSFFVYILTNQISFDDLGKYWIITNIASVIKNIFFVLAIYMEANKLFRKTSQNVNPYITNIHI